MKIARLTTKAIRGLGTRRFSFAGGPDLTPYPVLVVTGGPASGKTSLLRAIAAAKESVGTRGAPPAAATILESGKGDGQINADWVLSADEQSFAGLRDATLATTWNVGREVNADVDAGARLLFMRYDHSTHAKVEWIPAERRLPTSQTELLAPPFSEGTEAPKRCRDEHNKYDSLLRALHDVATVGSARLTELLDERGVVLRTQLPDQLGPVKESLARLCPDLRLLRVEPRGELRPLVWFLARKGGERELAELAHSDLAGALLAILFASVGLRGSIVLIDAPELHVHPREQARFFHAICDLGADNQVIAATTSAAILSSVAPEQIIDLSHPGSAE